jgi:serine/threonine-protein kinase
MPLEIGQTVQDRYRIDALLGSGGQGAVYRAYDTRLEQDVAIKENTIAGTDSLKQFKREALVLARMRHPNLPRVIDHFVTSENEPYLVMDFIAGDDLAHIVVSNGPLPEAQAVPWIRQACSALEYLHSQDPPIIHRDIKPQNIKVTPQGQVFLVDFGIAKEGSAASKTTVGAIGITPGFSPPEQYGLGSTDARSDIYALGATLYTLLTGQAPPSSISLLTGDAQLVPPRQVNATVSPAVQQAVLKAMETRRTDRPQDVAEFRQMLIVAERVAQPTQVASAAEEKAAPREPLLAPQPVAAPSVEPSRAKRNPLSFVLAGLGLVVLAFVAGAVALVVTALSKNSQVVSPPTQAASAPIAVLSTPTKALPTATENALGAATDTAVPAPTKVVSAPVAAPAVLACTTIGQTMQRAKDNADMVCVPAGQFLMGSANTDKFAQADEKPQHMVSLDAFWIDKTEITNAQYNKCVQAGACKEMMQMGAPMVMGDDLPAADMVWDDAEAYCRWVGAALPTEAQWEKAARGTDGRIYPWGNQAATCDYAVMTDSKGPSCGKGNAPEPVGSRPQGASPYGALDMAGNVWEFVADWYAPNYYAQSPSSNPQGPPSGTEHTVRGGSLFMDVGHVRATFRGSGVTHAVHGSQGFRCVLNVLP